MSNKRKLPGGPTAPKCAVCTRKVRASMGRTVLPAGLGIVCERCIARGATYKKLACGHYGVAGVKVLAGNDPRMSVCAACSSEGTLTEKVLGWIGPVEG